MRTAANELFSYFIYDHLVIVQITKEIKQKKSAKHCENSRICGIIPYEM